MRFLPIVGGLITALLFVSPSHAQVTVWSGPWCLVSRDGNPLDCSFRSMEQCHQTASGTAAHCYPNTYYPVRSDRRRDRRDRDY